MSLSQNAIHNLVQIESDVNDDEVFSGHDSCTRHSSLLTHRGSTTSQSLRCLQISDEGL